MDYNNMYQQQQQQQQGGQQQYNNAPPPPMMYDNLNNNNQQQQQFYPPPEQQDRSGGGHRSSRGDHHRDRSDRSDRDGHRSDRDGRSDRDRSDRHGHSSSSSRSHRDSSSRSDRDSHRGDRDGGSSRSDRDSSRSGDKDRESRDKDKDKSSSSRSRRKRSESPPPTTDFSKRRKTGMSGWDQVVPTIVPPLPTGPFHHHHNHFPPTSQGPPPALMGSGAVDGEQQLPPDHPLLQQGGVGVGGIPANPNAARQSRRLYVGNLPPNLTDIELVEFFNSAMLNAGAIIGQDGGSPCVAAAVSQEKAYAFLEFRSAQEATMGMSFDGITLRGQALRVRRPKDYVPAPEEEASLKVELLDIVSTNVEDGPHKIFIGGLPNHLNEQDVKELLALFGQLKAFNLVRDSSTGLSKGYAFCEYRDSRITDNACKSLNGMKIGEKTLVVQRASTNPKGAGGGGVGSTGDEANGGGIDSNGSGGDGGGGGGELPTLHAAAAAILNLATPPTALLGTLASKGTLVKPAEPSTVLVLLNVVDITTEWDDDYYDDVVEDMTQEAQKYGTLLKILLPRPAIKPKQPEEKSFLKPPSAVNEEQQQREETDSFQNLMNKIKQENDEQKLQQQQQQQPPSTVEVKQEPIENNNSNNNNNNTDGAATTTTTTATTTSSSTDINDLPEILRPPVAGFGKIFLEFANLEDAQRAQREFSGRRYDGRVVITSFHPASDFAANIL